MAQWLCMNCLKGKPGTRCPHCGKSDGELWNDGAHLPVFVQLKNGRYTVGVAQGSWGTSHGYTYAGYDTAANRAVYIKECSYVTEFGIRERAIPKDDTWFYDHLRSWRVNWETQRRLDLPALPKIWDVFDEGGTVYAISEKVEGISLRQFVKNLGGTLNAAGVFRLLEPLMRDLARAHSVGLFHEDITMDAIAITPDGRSRFFGFGLNENIGDSDLPLPPAKTPYSYLDQSCYSELERGQREDIYMMALVIYECLTGVERKYRDKKQQGPEWKWMLCDPMFNRYMRQAVERAASADPANQYLTMEEFRRDLLQGINWKEPRHEPIR